MSWDTGVKVVRSCPFMRFDGLVFVRWHVMRLLRLLDKEHPSTEFLIYARRREEDDNIIIVEDPAIPEQRVTAASVHVEKPDGDRDVVIHKHPSGLHDFSSIDDEYINANNALSLLYSDGRIVAAAVKKRLPCGNYAIIEVPIDNVQVLVVGSIEEEEEMAKRVFEEQGGNIKPYYSYYYGYTRTGGYTRYGLGGR